MSAPRPRLALRAWLRDALRHPWQTGLSVLGVAVGVAVVVAVHLASGSARSSFESANRMVRGDASWQVVGGPAGIDETVYRDLRLAGLRHVAPRIEGRVQTTGGQTLRVLGIDPFASRARNNWSNPDDDPVPWAELVGTPASTVMVRNTAERLGIAVGEPIPVLAAGRQRTLTLLARWQPANPVADTALADTLVVDLATAQILLDRPGRLDAIDVSPAAGAAGANEIEAIHARLGPGLELIGNENRAQAQQRMTAAFNTNLSALSLLALLIGMFLVYSTMSFAVVRRRHWIGVLRTLGLTRRELFAVVIIEAALLGAVASALGLTLGTGLANGLLALVTRTIDELYFNLGGASLQLAPRTLLVGFALGIAATVAAAVLPATEAARLAPGTILARSDLESRAVRMRRHACLAGVLMMLAAVLILWLSGRSIVAGFAGLFCLLLGYALTTPALLVVLLRVVGAISPRGSLLLHMARRGIERSLSRTGVAVAALAIAVSASIGISLMITSFRANVADWLNDRLRADIYLEMPDQQNLPPGFVGKLDALPGVAAITLARRATLESGAGQERVFAVDPYPSAFAGLNFIAGQPADVWPAFSRGRGVLVSEPWAFHHRKTVGDEVRLRTARGEHAFPILGVTRDYGSDQGSISMARALYVHWFEDPTTSAAAIYLEPGIDADTVIQGLQASPELPAAISIHATGALRTASLRVFDRTFAITSVLRLLAMVVAAIGILAALLGTMLERHREFAVLRVVGMTPAQIGRLLTLESGLLGLIAGLLSIPAGVGLAWVLLAVIDRRAFGWSISLSITPGALLAALVLALAAALAAAAWPAWQLAHASIARGLRAE